MTTPPNDHAPRPVDPHGKTSLFSGEPRMDGPFLLECSGCGRNSRVTAGRLLRLALPLNMTIPFRYHHTWMKCPACEERRWVRIRAFG